MQGWVSWVPAVFTTTLNLAVNLLANASPSLLYMLAIPCQVTDYINFQMLEATADQLDVFELVGWEAGLFAVCTFVMISAFLFWVVYMFEIIQAEVDALRAQQEVSCGQSGIRRGLNSRPQRYRRARSLCEACGRYAHNLKHDNFK